MKPLTDEYKLLVEARSGQYGFETFQDEENSHFYFLFNNHLAEAVLFSQGYSKAKSRNNGIASVLKNAAIPERYEMHVEGDQYFFFLKAGNHQQIARSRMESSFKDINNLKEMLLTVGNNAPINERPAEETKERAPKAQPKNIGPPKVLVSEEQKIENAPRQLYSLMLYKESGKVKIKHVLSQNSLTMEGLNGQAICEFIAGQLSPDWQSTIEIENTEMAGRGQARDIAPPIEVAEEAGVQEIMQAEVPLQGNEMSEEQVASSVDMLENRLSVEVAKENKEQLEPAVSMNQPVADAEGSDPEISTFEAFLRESPDESTVPEDISSLRDILAILRKPATPTEEKKSAANDFIESHGKNMATRSERKMPVDDVLEAYLVSGRQPREFLAGRGDGVSFELADLEAEEPVQQEQLSGDIVEMFIENRLDEDLLLPQNDELDESHLAALLVENASVGGESKFSETTAQPCPVCRS